MGRSGRGWESDKQSYRYWSGSWRARSWENKDKKKHGKTEQPALRLGSYLNTDVEKVTEQVEGPKEHSISSSDASGGDQFRQLQKWLNGARKSEARVRKLSEDLLLRHRKWAKFQEELKAAFGQERARYAADVAKLEGELATAKRSAIEAAALLKNFSGTGIGAMQIDAEQEEPVMDKEADAAWRELMEEPHRSKMTEDVDYEQMQTFLTHALMAAKEDAKTAKEQLTRLQSEQVPSAAASGLGAESLSELSVGTSGQISYVGNSPAKTDPYLPSPSVRKPPTPRASRPSSAVRVPIKVGGKQRDAAAVASQIAGPTLADKLAKRREAIDRAPMGEAINLASPLGGIAASVLIDDDGDAPNASEDMETLE